MSQILAQIPELPMSIRMTREQQHLGFFLSRHPVDYYGSYIRAFSTHSIADLFRLPPGTPVVFGGVCTEVKVHITRSGKKKYFFSFDDKTAVREVMLFSDRFIGFLKKYGIGLVSATVSVFDETQQIMMNGYSNIFQVPWVYGRILVLKIDQTNFGAFKSYVPDVLSAQPGTRRVFLDSAVPDQVKSGYTPYHIETSVSLINSLLSLLGPGKVKVAGRKGLAVDPFVKTIDDYEKCVLDNETDSYGSLIDVYGADQVVITNAVGKMCLSSAPQHIGKPLYYSVPGFTGWFRFREGEHFIPRSIRKQRRRKQKLIHADDHEKLNIQVSSHSHAVSMYEEE
jgi:hypothetical protein